jgi:putative endonuclease
VSGENGSWGGGGVRGEDDARAKGNPCRSREPARAAPAPAAHNFSGRAGSKDVGATFEARALVFLQRQRLRLVARNVVCRGGEIDLVMRDRDGALVFVEVRARAWRQYGSAAASVGWQNRLRLVRAAQHYLASRVSVVPACRFDVIAFEAGRLVWVRDAFRANEV